MDNYTRSVAAAADRDPHSARFEIHAACCPQLICKIVGLFAARSILPRDIRARQSCGGIWIAIDVDIDPQLVEPIAERMRAMISVAAVLAMHRAK